MKRILLFALFIFLLANLAACGRQENDPVPPSFDSGAVAKDADGEEGVRELMDNTAQFNNSFTVEGKPIIQDMSVAVFWSGIPQSGISLQHGGECCSGRGYGCPVYG